MCFLAFPLLLLQVAQTQGDRSSQDTPAGRRLQPGPWSFAHTAGHHHVSGS